MGFLSPIYSCLSVFASGRILALHPKEGHLLMNRGSATTLWGRQKSIVCEIFNMPSGHQSVKTKTLKILHVIGERYNVVLEFGLKTAGIFARFA
jgi:hypothetical protein